MVNPRGGPRSSPWAITPGPLGDPIVASTHVGPLRRRTIRNLPAVPVEPDDDGVGRVSFPVVSGVVVCVLVVLVLYGAVGCGGKRRASTTRNDTATMAASAIITRFDSRRWRFRGGRERGCDAIGVCSAAPRGSWWRELNSSTNGCPSRPRYSAYARRKPFVYVGPGRMWKSSSSSARM